MAIARLLTLAIFLFVSGCAAPGPASPGSQPEELLVKALARAIAAIPSPAEPLALAFGDFRCGEGHTREGNELRRRLEATLGRELGPGFKLLSPSRLAEILEAQKAQLSDLYRPKDSGVLGMLEGIDLLIVGDLFPGGAGTMVEVRVLDIRTGAEKAAVRQVFPWADATPVGDDPAVPLEVDFTLRAERFGREDRAWEEYCLADGGTLRSGDRFQAVVKATRESWAYLLLHDSQGDIHLLFPQDRGNASHRLKPRIEKFLPSRGRKWELDTVPGEETLILLVSLEPLEEVERLARDLEDLTGPERERAKKALADRMAGFRAKGIVGVSDSGVAVGPAGQADGERVARRYIDARGTVLERSVERLRAISGGDAIVRCLSFRHM